MSRPAVSVVVPFAGDPAQALVALALLRSLTVAPGDELILADNCGAIDPGAAGVTVVRAAGEASPSHARNSGAAAARNDWILFLDADTRAPAGLLDAYFVPGEPGPRAGVLVGEIEPAAGPRTVAGRYGAARNFLSQEAHLAHPFRPRAAAANVLVRREAFVEAGGFTEGVRAAEDTDFCWRLQDLGWSLEYRPGAVVGHEYRQRVGELRRQWRAYAAGRAWLARRYPGFHPEPAAVRVLRRLRGAAPPAAAPVSRFTSAPVAAPARGRFDRVAFLGLDALLAVEELIGLRQSNELR